MKWFSAAVTRQRDRLTRATTAATVRLMQLRQSAILRGRRWLGIASHGAIAAFGLALFTWTALGVQLPVDVQRLLVPLYVGAATLIGTMVVLAVNLSLIPVQRAAELQRPRRNRRR